MTTFFPKKIILGRSNNFSTITTSANDKTKHGARIRQVETDFISVYQPNPRHLYSIYLSAN